MLRVISSKIISSMIRSAALTGLAGVLLLSPLNGPGRVGSAAAQAVTVSADFRAVLEPYGTWHRYRRFDEVWVPANLPRNWHPYTMGHWVYTDDYGWYWVPDDQEAEWGWIAYHYGRWYHSAALGWFWVPDVIWGPAWVQWRYSDQYVGWAPEPPDEFVVEVEDDPVFWCFVGAGDLIAPAIATVLLPFQRREEFFHRTELINRPVIMQRSDRQFAVNPGIAPANIAAVRGQPLPTYNVRPHVLAGTAAVPGAIQVRAADLRSQRERNNRTQARERIATRDVIRSSSTVIKPAHSTVQPQSLARGESGRLGETPPRAAKGAVAAQRTASRPPGTPAALPQRDLRRQSTASQRSLEAEQRRSNVAPPNAPPRTTAQTPPESRKGVVERRGGGRDLNQPPTAIERRPREQTPVARAPVDNQGIAHRGPAARPPTGRPPTVAAAPRPVVPPPRAVTTPPQRSVAPAPRAAAAPPPRPVAPPPRVVAAPRPPPPPVAPAPRAVTPPAVHQAPPPVAAAARPAVPATTGTAPRGGPGQKKPSG